MRNLQVREIPAGQGTHNASQSPQMVKDTDLIASETVTNEHDTWEKGGGATRYNTTPNNGAFPYALLHDFWTASYTQQLLAVASNGTVQTIPKSGAATTVGSGFHSGAIWTCAEGADTQSGVVKNLYLTNNSRLDQMQAWNGTTLGPVAKPPADWTSGQYPTFCFFHNNRLFAGPGLSPWQIYSSVPNECSDFQSSGTLQWNLWPGESQRVIGGCAWERRAFVWKYPKGLFVLVDSDPTPTNWYWQKVNDAVGLVAPNAWVQVLNDVIFLGADGFLHSLSLAWLGFDQPVASDIMPLETGNLLRTGFDWTQIEKTQMCLWRLKRRIYIALPGVGTTGLSSLMIFDGHTSEVQLQETYEVGPLPSYTMQTRDTCGAVAIQINPTTNLEQVLVGSNDGYIYVLEQQARDKVGSGYTSYYETKDIDVIPGGQYRANLYELEVVFAAGGSWTLYVDVYLDGTYAETLYYLQTQVSAALDTMELDNSNAVLGYDTVLNNRQRLSGSARRVRLHCYNNLPDYSFSVVTHLIKYLPGSERP